MFKPKESATIRDIKSARSLKEMEGIIKRIGDEVKRKKSRLRNLFKKLSKVFKFGLSVSAKDETMEVGRRNAGPSVRRGKGSVKAYLKDYVHPKDVDGLATSLAHIDEYYQLAYELEMAEATLMKKYSGFEKSREATLKELQNHIDDISESLNEAFILLNKASKKISKDHAPKELTSWARSLYNYLKKQLEKGSYSEIDKPVLYASTNNDGSINYQYFIEIEDATTSSNYTFEEYWFVLTATITKTGELTYYLITLDGFETPGKFDPGRPISSKANMLRRANSLMDADRVVTELERKPIPGSKHIGRGGITKLKGVKNAKVFNDTLYVFLNKSIRANQINEILRTLIPLLQTMLGVKHTNSNLIHKVEKTRTGQRVVKFVLTPKLGSKKDTIIKRQLDDFMDQIGANGKVKDQIKRVLMKY